MPDMQLNMTFESAKIDITDCWENPMRKDDKILRNWIYAVDPETMTFCKALFGIVKGDNSLYDVFVMVMGAANLTQILKTETT